MIRKTNIDAIQTIEDCMRVVMSSNDMKDIKDFTTKDLTEVLDRWTLIINQITHHMGTLCYMVGVSSGYTSAEEECLKQMDEAFEDMKEESDE